MSHCFVLADCNNFYASCERLFNPRLEGCPLIVLSNNDGCVVARSQEAKKLGIKMGDPWFKIRDLCRNRGVLAYSSNYQLYGDISQRIMRILEERAPEIEIYSIDEAFLKYPSAISVSELLELRQIVKRWVGIPTSFGAAPTKTLAKVANDLAKKDATGGFDLMAPDRQEKVLRDFPIGDIWGIGSQTRDKLYAMGVRTAWQFRELDPYCVRRRLGIVGERMLWELRGVSCLPLVEPEPRQSITCSRSFGQVVTEQGDLAEALASHVNSACIKLRGQESCAHAICIFLEAYLNVELGLRQTLSTVLPFSLPTNDTPQIIQKAKQGLQQIFCKEKRYKKCGIILLDLIPEHCVVPDLFFGDNDPKRRYLAGYVDCVNDRFGKNTVFYAAMGVNPRWKMRSEKRSRRYTSSWDELAIVKA